MRFLPTIVHGVADYMVGCLVIALPFIFGIGSPARFAFVGLGVFVLAYSLLTDYELGAFRILRIRFHLLLDAIFAVVMLLFPTLFNLPSDLRWLSYLIGVLGLVLVITTKVRAQGSADQSDSRNTS